MRQKAATGRGMCWAGDYVVKTNPKSKAWGDLLCATVMFFDETLEKFKLLYRDGKDELLYRDGKDEWVTGYQIDDNLDHEEGYKLQDKVAAEGEPWTEDAQRKIKTYGEYCVQYVGIKRKWGPTTLKNP